MKILIHGVVEEVVVLLIAADRFWAYSQLARLRFNRRTLIVRVDCIWSAFLLKWFFKCTSDPSHFIFEINVAKSRIRHITTLNLNDVIFNRFRIDPEIHHSAGVGALILLVAGEGWGFSYLCLVKLKRPPLYFRVVVCRIRLIATMISEIK